MAVCAIDNSEIMTRYYMRISRIDAVAGVHLDIKYICFDCTPQAVTDYLADNITYGAKYQTRWRPWNAQLRREWRARTIDEETPHTNWAAGMVMFEETILDEADIRRIVAGHPFGGILPRPYYTTEQMKAIQNGHA